MYAEEERYLSGKDNDFIHFYSRSKITKDVLLQRNIENKCKLFNFYVV